jgi:hypothetical protein
MKKINESGKTLIKKFLTLKKQNLNFFHQIENYYDFWDF